MESNSLPVKFIAFDILNGHTNNDGDDNNNNPMIMQLIFLTF